VDVSVLESLVDDRPTPEARLLDMEKEAALRTLLRQLPERFRAPVILKDVEGLSYDEVAAALDCSVGTVSSRLNRGRKMLARKLGRGK
jgi:RNA polymerase sigma-70 factor (ECF subfamily)